MERIHASSTPKFAPQRYAYTVSQLNHEQLVRLSRDPWVCLFSKNIPQATDPQTPGDTYQAPQVACWSLSYLV